jgi:peptidoglycan L-alanyl-D-glutamate endopeptidase CwlK
MKEKCQKLKDLCEKKGIPIIITCTARTVQEQTALYSQGRNSITETNRLRKIAGLPPITASENKNKITWTMKSMHLIDLTDTNPDNNKARAFDFAILKAGVPVWNLKVDVNANMVGDYKEVGMLGESIGLVWGGRWKTPDNPHFQQPDEVCNKQGTPTCPLFKK